jgi:hypothetical protein
MNQPTDVPPGMPPQIASNPQLFFLYLRNQGYPQDVAINMTNARFGTPKTPDEQQKDAASRAQKTGFAQVGGLLAGTVGGAAAAQGIKAGYDALFKPSPTQQTQQVTQPTPTVTQPTATNTQPTPPSATQTSAATQPVTEVGSTTMPDGSPGTLMSDGARIGNDGQIIKPDGSYGGSFQGQALAGLQVAGGAAQAYSGYKQYQSGEKIGGAANIAGGAYNTAAGVQALANGGTAGSLGAYAPGVGTAVAAAQIGQQMVSDKGSSEDRAAKSQAEAQKAALLWIPGYGWVAYAALAGLDAITGGKATKTLMDINTAQNKVMDRIDFGLGKNIRSKVFHQSTKGVQEMHSGQLMQQSDDPQWQGYVGAMRSQVAEGPKDKSKPFAGKYKTFNEYKQAGLEAGDLTGVYGNLDAFKPDYAEKAGVPNWSQLSFDQQKAVTQRLIDEDMYSSKKGEVVIADKEKARRIYEDMYKTQFGVPAAGSVQSSPMVPRPGKGEVARQSAGLYRNDRGQLIPGKTMKEALSRAYEAPSKQKRK